MEEEEGNPTLSKGDARLWEQDIGTRTSVHVGIFGGGLDECRTSMLLNLPNPSQWLKADGGGGQSTNTMLCWCNLPNRCKSCLNPCKPWTNQQIQNRLQPLKGGTPQDQNARKENVQSIRRSNKVHPKNKSSTTAKHHIPTDYDQLLSDSMDREPVKVDGGELDPKSDIWLNSKYSTFISF